MYRISGVRIVALESFTVLYAFTAAALRPDHPSFLDDPAALLRLAIPAVAAIAGLQLRDRLAGPERPPSAAAIDVVLAFGLAFISQVLLARFRPDLVLPRWAPTEGCLVSFFFLAGLRAFFPPGPPTAQDLGDLPPLAEFRRFVYPAVAVLAAFSAIRFLSAVPRSRVGYALLFEGALWLAWQFQQAAPSLPDSAILLRRVWYWYGGSLIPALALLLPGSRIYLYFVLLPVLLSMELALRYGERLRGELPALTPPVRSASSC